MTNIYKNGSVRVMTETEEAGHTAIQAQLTAGLSADQGKASRMLRDVKLSTSDWTQAADSPLTSAKKTAWATYRTALRNLPTADTEWPDTNEITWPTEPT